MKKILSAALTLALTLSMIPAAFAAGGTAYASTQAVEVDGKKVEFQMYALKDASGNPTNYVKLRDVAHVLNGTRAQFAVGYDGSISVTTGTAYTDVGGEMSTPYSGDRGYREGSGAVKVNGQAASLESIILTDDAGGDYTYFKLRDLGSALGFKVDWSAQRGVFIETGAAQSTGDPNLDLFQGAWKGSFQSTYNGTMSEEIIITGDKIEQVQKEESKNSPAYFRGTVLVQTNVVNPNTGRTYPYALTMTINERWNESARVMEPYAYVGYYYVQSVDSAAGKIDWSFGTYNRMDPTDPNSLYAAAMALQNAGTGTSDYTYGALSTCYNNGVRPYNMSLNYVGLVVGDALEADLARSSIAFNMAGSSQKRDKAIRTMQSDIDKMLPYTEELLASMQGYPDIFQEAIAKTDALVTSLKTMRSFTFTTEDDYEFVKKNVMNGWDEVVEAREIAKQRILAYK